MTTRFKSTLINLFLGATLFSPIIIMLFLLCVGVAAALGIIVIGSP